YPNNASDVCAERAGVSPENRSLPARGASFGETSRGESTVKIEPSHAQHDLRLGPHVRAARHTFFYQHVDVPS
ncbi:hypothetical protein C6A85_43550, partial [Mycobacterium sp. ITM-2017-0098]